MGRPRGKAQQTWSPDQLRAEMEMHDPRASKPESLLTLDERIYQLKIAGLSNREISVGVQATEAEVNESIMRSAESSRTRLASELSIAAILEIDRLDRLLKALWPAAEAGDYGASDRVSALSKERRRLMGTDAPEVKASLSISSAAQVDLSPLSLEQLKQWEAIQQTLLLSKGKKTKAKDVIDVLPEPKHQLGAKPGAEPHSDPEP